MSIFPLSEEMKECCVKCDNCYRNPCDIHIKELDLREKVVLKLAEIVSAMRKHRLMEPINRKDLEHLYFVDVEQIIQQAVKEITIKG